MVTYHQTVFPLVFKGVSFTCMRFPWPVKLNLVVYYKVIFFENLQNQLHQTSSPYSSVVEHLSRKQGVVSSILIGGKDYILYEDFICCTCYILHKS